MTLVTATTLISRKYNWTNSKIKKPTITAGIVATKILIKLLFSITLKVKKFLTKFIICLNYIYYNSLLTPK